MKTTKSFKAEIATRSARCPARLSFHVAARAQTNARVAAMSQQGGGSSMLRFTGAAHFRQRILLATLTGRPVRIDGIREGGAKDHTDVGLRDFEACFLRLVEKVVNGCEIVINETGTALNYRPGIIVGGEALSHDCGVSRAVGYFAQPLLMLAPFAKAPLSITLKGVTNMPGEISVDVLRTVTLPLLRHFGIDGAALHVAKRGAPPLGGGEVRLEVPPVRQLLPVSLIDPGKVRRVRGVAYGAKVSPQMANRVVDGTRGVLNDFLPDVWVYTDLHKGKSSGASPGYGLALVAETTSGALLSAEHAGSVGVLPEDLGVTVADALLEEIASGGAVDAANQPLLCAAAGRKPAPLRAAPPPPPPPLLVTLRARRDPLRAGSLSCASAPRTSPACASAR